MTAVKKVKIADTEIIHCGIGGKATACHTSSPYGHMFKYWLLHFPYSFLLMCMGKQQRWRKCLVPYTCMGDPEETSCFWLSDWPSTAIVAI